MSPPSSWTVGRILVSNSSFISATVSSSSGWITKTRKHRNGFKNCRKIILLTALQNSLWLSLTSRNSKKHWIYGIIKNNCILCQITITFFLNAVRNDEDIFYFIYFCFTIVVFVSFVHEVWSCWFNCQICIFVLGSATL